MSFFNQDSLLLNAKTLFPSNLGHSCIGRAMPCANHSQRNGILSLFLINSTVILGKYAEKNTLKKLQNNCPSQSCKLYFLPLLVQYHFLHLKYHTFTNGVSQAEERRVITWFSLCYIWWILLENKLLCVLYLVVFVRKQIKLWFSKCYWLNDMGIILSFTELSLASFEVSESFFTEC